MANVIIAYPNRAEECAITGGNWLPSLPLANLRNRFLRVPARSATLAETATWFAATMARQRPVRIVSLVGHNFSDSATYRMRVYADAEQTQLLHDTGVIDVWPAVMPTEALEWEYDEFWSGKQGGEDREGMTWSLPIILPQPIVAQSIRIDIVDAANTAGYIDIGRLFIAGEWQPAYNFDYGHRLGYQDDTRVSRTLAGVEHFDRKRLYRIASIALSNMSIDEGLGVALEMQRQVGISREVYLVHDPDDTIHMLRRSFLGRLRTLSPVDHPYVNVTATAFEIQEII